MIQIVIPLVWLGMSMFVPTLGLCYFFGMNFLSRTELRVSLRLSKLRRGRKVCLIFLAASQDSHFYFMHLFIF